MIYMVYRINPNFGMCSVILCLRQLMKHISVAIKMKVLHRFVFVVLFSILQNTTTGDRKCLLFIKFRV